MLVSPEGEVIHNYRKTFLYETDQSWAVAGTFFAHLPWTLSRSRLTRMRACFGSDMTGEGFSYIDLPQPIGRLSIGICMDINNGTDFTSPWDAYELATFARKSQSRLLALTLILLTL